MKKIFKFFLVLTLLLSNVPVNNVNAMFKKSASLEKIEKTQTISVNSYQNDDFTELMVEDGFYLIDEYGSIHEIYYFGCEEIDENTGNLIFGYYCESTNKYPYILVDLYRQQYSLIEYEESYLLDASEEIFYFEVPFDKEHYNREYIYLGFGNFETLEDEYLYDYAQVKVKNPYYKNPVTSIAIEGNYIYQICVGKPFQLEYRLMTYYAGEATEEVTVTWSSSDETIATVDENGLVTPVGAGAVTITATTSNGLSDSENFYSSFPPADLQPEQESYVFNYEDGEYHQVVFNVSPEEYYPYCITWSLSNKSTLYWDRTEHENGKYIIKFQLKDSGQTTLTIQTETGITKSIDITTIVPVYNFTFDIPKDDLMIGETVQLSVYDIKPANPAGDSTMTWVSENPEIATVDETGLVTAVSGGTVKIYCNVASGFQGWHIFNVVPEVPRIYGDTRYETCLKSADFLLETLGIEKFETVVVATGESYPDALTGSYLANKNNAPILMTNAKRLDEIVAYIQEKVVEGGKIYILGGEKAVPYELEEKLTGYNIKRLAGNTRYETNIEILKEAGIDENSELLIATGKNYADCLSAASTGNPILLVDRYLGDLQLEYFKYYESISDIKALLIGGRSAVSGEVEEALGSASKHYGYGSYLNRLSGSDRIDTSLKIANRYFPDTKSYVFVYARNYPDGLSGGSLGYALNSPIILIEDKPEVERMIQKYVAPQYGYEARDAVILGGPGLISDELINSILKTEEIGNPIVTYK